MKKFTKAIAVFCAMAMVVSVFSATVLADDEQNTEEQSQEIVGVEPAANEEPTPEQEPEQETDPEPDPDTAPFVNGVITQADIDNNDDKMPETAGDYTLAEDITVSGSAQISAAGSQVTIDLAGHTITYTGTDNLYTVGLVEEATVNGHSSVLVHGNIVLTIKDSGTDGKIIASNTTTGGVDHWISIDGNYPKYGTENGHRGGCILVQNSCTLKLEGGTISGFHSQSDGGAIHVSNGGHCEMSGGRITDCHSDSLKPNDDGAGAISCHCTSQGTEAKNALLKTSENEEAVVTTISLKGSLKITGGQIDHCSGRQGGAIRILRADFEITGGTITENSGLIGGGILFAQGQKKTGTIKISGNPVITGNHATGGDATKANLWLLDGATVILSDNLDSTAQIEFGTSNPNGNIFDINGKTYSIDSFICDHADYITYVSGSNIKIKAYKLPKVTGYVIGIGGEIFFKVYVDFGDASQSAVSTNYTYSYTKAGSAEVVINKDATEFNSDSNGTYFVIPVESACMTAPITITLSCEGHEKVYTTSVEDVANDSVAIDSSYADLVNALLTYGGYAQVQLKINTGKLPSVDGVNFAEAPDFGLTSGTYAPASDPDRAFGGANVSFLSKTEIKLRFSKSALGDTAPTMTVNYAEGSKTVEAVEAGNYYIYTLKGYDGAGFKASQYDVTFEYSVGNVSGEYSINTYLKVIFGTGIQSMKNLAQAYYGFAKKSATFA